MQKPSVLIFDASLAEVKALMHKVQLVVVVFSQNYLEEEDLEPYQDYFRELFKSTRCVFYNKVVTDYDALSGFFQTIHNSIHFKNSSCAYYFNKEKLTALHRDFTMRHLNYYVDLEINPVFVLDKNEEKVSLTYQPPPPPPVVNKPKVDTDKPPALYSFNQQQQQQQQQQLQQQQQQLQLQQQQQQLQQRAIAPGSQAQMMMQQQIPPVIPSLAGAMNNVNQNVPSHFPPRSTSITNVNYPNATNNTNALLAWNMALAKENPNK